MKTITIHKAGRHYFGDTPTPGAVINITEETDPDIYKMDDSLRRLDSISEVDALTLFAVLRDALPQSTFFRLHAHMAYLYSGYTSTAVTDTLQAAKAVKTAEAIKIIKDAGEKG